MVKTYTIESTDHCARMSEHEDGPWVPKAVYDAIAFRVTVMESAITGMQNQRDALAAELSGYKESHDKYCPSAERVRVLEATLRRIQRGVDCSEQSYEYAQEVLDSALETAVEQTTFRPLKDGLCVHCGRDARNHDFGGPCRPGSAMQDLTTSDRQAETLVKPKCNHSLNQGTTLQRIENMIDCTVCGKTWQEIAADNSARFQDDRQAETGKEHGG